MIADILLYLNDDGHEHAHVGAAADVAQTHGARLTGLAVAEPLAAHAEYLPPDALDRYRDAWRSRNLRLADTFNEVLANRGLSTEWRSVEDLRVDRSTVDVIALQARYADLLIVGQVDPERPADLVPSDLPGQAAVMAGRPVLALPYAWEQRAIGKRIVIGWDGERESARAVADAMPFLQAADQVHVLVVGSQQGPRERHGDLPGADIAAHLARHGVNVEASSQAISDIPVADALLSAAADRRADCLVMGAYGRSRFREMVLGGTTRRILNEMTLPVLLSH
ncbi:MAG: universal stress protein [Spiribacter sp.]|jgi:nucleotide-binding universal stress UspA family protein|nr:universal stress protein [Spiribacter sp.]MDR9489954.1 universal stress protein [Spiribacter sp.]